MLAWLRDNHPDLVDEKTAHQRAFRCLFQRTKELGFSKAYKISRVMVPQPVSDIFPRQLGVLSHSQPYSAHFDLGSLLC